MTRISLSLMLHTLQRNWNRCHIDHHCYTPHTDLSMLRLLYSTNVLKKIIIYMIFDIWYVEYKSFSRFFFLSMERACKNCMQICVHPETTLWMRNVWVWNRRYPTNALHCIEIKSADYGMWFCTLPLELGEQQQQRWTNAHRIDERRQNQDSNFMFAINSKTFVQLSTGNSSLCNLLSSVSHSPKLSTLHITISVLNYLQFTMIIPLFAHVKIGPRLSHPQ